jgi:hypothetical protein
MAYTGSVPSAVTDDAYTATLQEITDTETKSQTYSKMPAFSAVWKNKQSGTAGSNRHEWSLRAGRNSNAKTMTSDADSVEFSMQSHVITAYYDYMAMNVVPVLGSKLRDSINSGTQARVKLIQEDLRQASETLSAMLSTQTFGDGSSKTIIGLDAILNIAPGSNTVFGVPESSAAFWKNQYETSAGSFAANGLHGSSVDKLTSNYLKASDNGAMTPDVVISDRTVVEYFIRAEGQKKRITKDADFAVIGKSAVGNEAGKGLPFYDAQWVWDNECPAGYVYMLHSEDFVLVEDPNFNFKWFGPIPLGKQFLLNGRVLTHRAQSKVYRRNRNAVVSGWTA